MQEVYLSFPAAARGLLLLETRTGPSGASGRLFITFVSVPTATSAGAAAEGRQTSTSGHLLLQPSVKARLLRRRALVCSFARTEDVPDARPRLKPQQVHDCMKVKAINRSETECTRERSQDLRKVHKNLDPALHPFERAVEYTRALNAVKLDRWARFLLKAEGWPADLLAHNTEQCKSPGRLSLCSGCLPSPLSLRSPIKTVSTVWRGAPNTSTAW